MRSRFVDELVFNVKKVIFLLVFWLICLAFLTFIYWFLSNLKISLGVFLDNFVLGVVGFFTAFFKNTSFYNQTLEIQPIAVSVLLAIFAYLLNLLTELIDKLHNMYKQAVYTKRVRLENKINKQLQKEFLKELNTYELMLVKVKIDADDLSTYLTHNINGKPDKDSLVLNVVNDIFMSFSPKHSVQKGKTANEMFYLVSNLSDSKDFFNELVDITTTVVNKNKRPNLKIKFFCAADLLDDIREFDTKQKITDEIIDLQIENKIIVTPEFKLFHEIMYRDKYTFSAHGEYNLPTKKSQVMLHSLKRK